MKTAEVGQHLVAQSRNGRRTLVFKGTRLSVAGVFRRLARGESVGEIVKATPQLTPEAIREAVKLASAALIDQVGARSPEHLKRKPLPEPKPVGRYLIVHPNVCFSKLTFDRTRLTVARMLFYRTNYTLNEMLHWWPELKREALAEALQLAAAALMERYAVTAETARESAHS
ncbi:MAG TPA: DUF433 domain-containing protein [Gemmataceae bacterium]|nr:DUF433 domain-containing protein [Gemmataceae bacterium]